MKSEHEVARLACSIRAINVPPPILVVGPHLNSLVDPMGY